MNENQPRSKLSKIINLVAHVVLLQCYTMCVLSESIINLKLFYIDKKFGFDSTWVYYQFLEVWTIWYDIHYIILIR